MAKIFIEDLEKKRGFKLLAIAHYDGDVHVINRCRSLTVYSNHYVTRHTGISASIIVNGYSHNPLKFLRNRFSTIDVIMPGLYSSVVKQEKIASYHEHYDLVNGWGKNIYLGLDYYINPIYPNDLTYKYKELELKYLFHDLWNDFKLHLGNNGYNIEESDDDTSQIDVKLYHNFKFNLSVTDKSEVYTDKIKVYMRPKINSNHIIEFMNFCNQNPYSTNDEYDYGVDYNRVFLDEVSNGENKNVLLDDIVYGVINVGAGPSIYRGVAALRDDFIRGDVESYCILTYKIDMSRFRVEVPRLNKENFDFLISQMNSMGIYGIDSSVLILCYLLEFYPACIRMESR